MKPWSWKTQDRERGRQRIGKRIYCLGGNTDTDTPAEHRERQLSRIKKKKKNSHHPTARPTLARTSHRQARPTRVHTRRSSRISVSCFLPSPETPHPGSWKRQARRRELGVRQLHQAQHRNKTLTNASNVRQRSSQYIESSFI